MLQAVTGPEGFLSSVIYEGEEVGRTNSVLKSCLRRYNGPSMSMGSASADSTNPGLKIILQSHIVADVQHVARPATLHLYMFNMHVLFSLSFFPKQPGVTTTYAAFTLCSGCSAAWDDFVYRRAGVVLCQYGTSSQRGPQPLRTWVSSAAPGTSGWQGLGDDCMRQRKQESCASVQQLPRVSLPERGGGRGGGSDPWSWGPRAQHLRAPGRACTCTARCEEAELWADSLQVSGCQRGTQVKKHASQTREVTVAGQGACAGTVPGRRSMCL